MNVLPLNSSNFITKPYVLPVQHKIFENVSLAVCLTFTLTVSAHINTRGPTPERDTATGQDTCQTSEASRYNNKTQRSRISTGNSQEGSQSRGSRFKRLIVYYETNKQCTRNLVLE